MPKRLSAPPERIEHAINKVGRLVLYLLLLVGLVEAASWAMIQFYNWAFLRYELNEVVREPDPDGEVGAVMSHSILFPTRWYMCQPNFRGRYVVTDDAGFRIDPTAVTEAKSIGFFGGSIMFSILTRQEHTIPALVHLPGFNSLNFGVHGYSTTAELPTLLEALRKYRLEVAVFYDGGAETARYLEMLQDGAPEAFAAVGYYNSGGIDYALASYFSWHQAGVIVQTPSMRITKRAWLMLRAQAVSQSQNLEEIARSIAAQYFANIRDIQLIARANSVAPIFVWHPDIYMTGKRLTPAELAIRDRPEKTLFPQLDRLVRSAVMSDPRARTYDVVDLSDVFDAAEGEIFYDPFHVGAAGNKIVADRLIALISARLQ